MRVLIYEPLPDMNRAPIIAQLAKTLMADGHDVLVVIEEKLIYTLLGKLTHQGVINCSRTWRRHIGAHKEINVYKLKTPWNLYWLVNATNFADRLQDVATLRRQQYRKLLDDFAPDRIFVWNGQHEHLQDFMSTAKQTHEGRFIYMECGWFPQKGTIYFDSEGVNAASSIAMQPMPPLNPDERQQLDIWQQNYAKVNSTEVISKRIFVPLQVETDTNITLYSPFKSMQEFVNYLSSWVPQEYSVVLRPHPLAAPSAQPTTPRPGFLLESHVPVEQLIDTAELVVGINSTVLLQALARKKPVICFGNGFLPATSTHASFSAARINTYNTASSLLYTLIFNKQDSTKSCAHARRYLGENRSTSQ